MAEVVAIHESVDIDSLLGRIDAELRRLSLQKALKAAGKPVVRQAKARCPVGQGRTGVKAGKKHLRDTIGQVYREYGGLRILVVGPTYPAGAHGHLVEYGHDEVLFGKPTGRRVPPHPFMRPAVDETKSEQIDAFESTLRKDVERIESEARHNVKL